MDPVRRVRSCLVRLPAAQVWALLSDTDHLNRVLRLPAVHYGPLNADGSCDREAFARFGGVLPLRWVEHPFEWVHTSFYRVRRTFVGGPFVRFMGEIELAERDATTCEVTARAEIEPRSAWGRLLGALLTSQSLAQMMGYCRQFEAAAASEAQPDPPRLAQSLADRAALERVMNETRRHVPEFEAILARLHQHLLRGMDDEVAAMRPYELADRWGFPRPDVLRALLAATRAGALELEWQLLCPNCRVPKARYASLAALTPEFHCDLCGIDYEADFDQATELRFKPAPAIRAASDAVYCIGSPARSPHILAQVVLGPGEQRRIELPEPGPDQAPALRLRVLRANETAPVHVPGHAAWVPGGWTFRAGTPEQGRWPVFVENRSDTGAVAVLESTRRDERVATAAEVTTMEEFRQHFSAEVLAPGRQVAVRQICILFTDLKASTALYEDIGDAPAFGRVRRHFDLLASHVGAHDGAVVKTIGDAVMAAFPSLERGVAAACAIQRAIAPFNASHAYRPPIVLKMGLHAGPAIAVNANGLLDYFGRSVNLAARIQSQSSGDDLVLAADVAAQPDVQRWIRGEGVEIERFEAELRGVNGAIELVRIRWNSPSENSATPSTTNTASTGCDKQAAQR